MYEVKDIQRNMKMRKGISALVRSFRIKIPVPTFAALGALGLERNKLRSV